MRLRFAIGVTPELAHGDFDLPGPAVERVVEIPFDSDEIIIGRLEDSALALPFRAISGRHARLFRDASGYHIVDLGSANGTRLGRRPLLPHVALAIAVGEVIDVAGVHLRFEGETPAASPVLGGEGTATLARRLVHDLFEACPPSERARLVVVAGPALGRELVLAASDRVYRLGRGDQCDLMIQDDDVSREHATFERGAEGIIVRDLGSKNGVEVDGHVIEDACCLRDGQVVRVGETRLQVVDPEDRYLRQIEQCGDPSSPAGEVIAPFSGPKGAPARRLSIVAVAIAATALLLALGLVLALAIAS